MELKATLRLNIPAQPGYTPTFQIFQNQVTMGGISQFLRNQLGLEPQNYTMHYKDKEDDQIVAEHQQDFAVAKITMLEQGLLFEIQVCEGVTIQIKQPKQNKVKDQQIVEPIENKIEQPKQNPIQNFINQKPIQIQQQIPNQIKNQIEKIQEKQIIKDQPNQLIIQQISKQIQQIQIKKEQEQQQKKLQKQKKKQQQKHKKKLQQKQKKKQQQKQKKQHQIAKKKQQQKQKKKLQKIQALKQQQQNQIIKNEKNKELTNKMQSKQKHIGKEDKKDHDNQNPLAKKQPLIGQPLTKEQITNLIRNQIFQMLPTIKKELKNDSIVQKQVRAVNSILCNKCNNPLQLPYYYNTVDYYYLCSQCQAKDDGIYPLLKIRSKIDQPEQVCWVTVIQVLKKQVNHSYQKEPGQYYSDIKIAAVQRIKNQIDLQLHRVKQQRQKRLQQKKRLQIEQNNKKKEQMKKEKEQQTKKVKEHGKKEQNKKIQNNANQISQ